MKNTASSARLGAGASLRSASAAQVPLPSAIALAIEAGQNAGAQLLERVAAQRVGVVAQRQLARQHAVPLAG